MKWNRTRRASALVAAGALALLTGCATNTMTGRTQMSLISDEAVSKQSLSYYSAMVGDYRKKEKVIDAGPVKERVERITNRLIAQAVLYRPAAAQWDWRVTVIDDPETVNAFCMPGGLMGIYTGFMEKLNASDDEIAQVMGHEIGHALAGHGAEKMSLQLTSNLVVMVLSAATAQNARDMQGTHAALSVGALAFVNRPNDRLTEHEADRIGIELAARAGYDPTAAVTLWDKMGKLSGNKRAHFLSTHPSSEQRAQTLNDMQAPMRKFQARALEAQAGQAPGQGHANNQGHGHEHDWLNAPKASRPAIDESKAIALYSPRWEDFEMGRIELKGSNTPGFVMKQRALKEMHDQARWRDLASTVMDLDHRLDLSYHYLGVAAKGMGFEGAGRKYLEKARQLGQDKATSCVKSYVISCAQLIAGR